MPRWLALSPAEGHECNHEREEGSRRKQEVWSDGPESEGVAGGRRVVEDRYLCEKSGVLAEVASNKGETGNRERREVKGQIKRQLINLIIKEKISQKEQPLSIMGCCHT